MAGSSGAPYSNSIYKSARAISPRTAGRGSTSRLPFVVLKITGRPHGRALSGKDGKAKITPRGVGHFEVGVQIMQVGFHVVEAPTGPPTLCATATAKKFRHPGRCIDMLDVQRGILSCKWLSTVERRAPIGVELVPKDVAGSVVVGNADLIGAHREHTDPQQEHEGACRKDVGHSTAPLVGSVSTTILLCASGLLNTTPRSDVMEERQAIRYI